MIFLLLLSHHSFAQQKKSVDPNDKIGNETKPSVIKTAILPLEAINPALTYSMESDNKPILFDSKTNSENEKSTKNSDKEKTSN